MFDAIVVSRFLWRPLFPQIFNCLAVGGVLIYETFAAGNEQYGSPRNPDFLLRAGELVERTCETLIPIAYDHATLTEPPRLVARIAAVGPDHIWLKNPPRAAS